MDLSCHHNQALVQVPLEGGPSIFELGHEELTLTPSCSSGARPFCCNFWAYSQLLRSAKWVRKGTTTTLLPVGCSGSRAWAGWRPDSSESHT
jgi:hypothetical protein